MEQTIGEIRMFAGNYAPQGWAICDGKLLPTFEYETLYTLIGTTYGGDGVSTFGLPDMRGRVPVDAGQGPGLPAVGLGERGGTEQVTISIANLPQHTHGVKCVQTPGDTLDPTGKYIAGSPTAAKPEDQIFHYVNMSDSPAVVAMQADSVSAADGKSQPVSIMQPYTAINFIIALSGVFPSRA